MTVVGEVRFQQWQPLALVGADPLVAELTEAPQLPVPAAEVFVERVKAARGFSVAGRPETGDQPPVVFLREEKPARIRCEGPLGFRVEQKLVSSVVFPKRG